MCGGWRFQFSLYENKVVQTEAQRVRCGRRRRRRVEGYVKFALSFSLRRGEVREERIQKLFVPQSIDRRFIDWHCDGARSPNQPLVVSVIAKRETSLLARKPISTTLPGRWFITKRWPLKYNAVHCCKMLCSLSLQPHPITTSLLLVSKSCILRLLSISFSVAVVVAITVVVNCRSSFRFNAKMRIKQEKPVDGCGCGCRRA